MDAGTRSQEFVTLGHAGSEHYAGLETFPNPGVSRVELTSDELTAVCPVTGQPDLYEAAIEYTARSRLECPSSSTCRASATKGVLRGAGVKIRDDVAERWASRQTAFVCAWRRIRPAGSRSSRSPSRG
jgi:hypothetical protein